MALKKNPAACDGRVKAISTKHSAVYRVTALESQVLFVRRRFGVAPLRAEIIARLTFGEVRR